VAVYKGCHDVGLKITAPWISQQLGQLVFHIAVWFWVLHCFGIGSAYWR